MRFKSYQKFTILFLTLMYFIHMRKLVLHKLSQHIFLFVQFFFRSSFTLCLFRLVSVLFCILFFTPSNGCSYFHCFNKARKSAYSRKMSKNETVKAAHKFRTIHRSVHLMNRRWQDEFVTSEADDYWVENRLTSHVRIASCSAKTNSTANIKVKMFNYT